MDKLKMHTPNIADENFAALAKLFPNAVTETIDPATGEVVRAIDKDVLMQEINTRVVDGKEERYQFTWPDKKKAVLAANSPISATLRPCREESVDFDTTENLYIEGDNLDVLKLLQETYLGRVKMIYIDPPYNTGNDFVYNDDFAESAEDYLDRSGQYDEDGNRLVQNTESNGRFHTDWLNMIYPRLKLAKSLLSEDGVIFISIDENEVQNLRKICDEIFGEANFISQLGWQKVYSPKNQARYFSNDYEFILCYTKNIEHFTLGMLPRTKEMNARYKNPDNDPRGDWKPGDCVGNGERKNGYYDVVSPITGKVFNVPQGKHWVYAPETMKKLLEENRIYFGKDGNAFPAVKQFLCDVSGRRASSFLMYDDYGHTDMAKKDLIKLFQDLVKVPFDTPKPVKLIKMLSILGTKENDIVLDFFSGSATTAHAVMQLNVEDGGHRKFIMVQLPEPCDEKSEAYKAGYKNICEIGKERIRRAAKKIAEEHPEAQFDGGFRVLKLDTSNMQEVYYTPAEFTQATLDGVADNIKPDRTPMDLLFQVMLDLGVLLSGKIEENTICGKTVFNVEDNYLIACFDENITDEVITAIAKQKPYYFVMRDSSMADDSVATNFEQIFATYSPDTVRRVL
ncbi:MAG: site-specific DNA-methyltransferase [Oscillospiraceae bacterium]|nr:site-specific DNA-methyltransferase [Oscillospiraceae bacterium]